MDDMETDLATPSEGSNDGVNTSDEWVPMCDEELKPVIGKVFTTLEEGENFYKWYAHIVGFSVRKSSENKRQ